MAPSTSLGSLPNISDLDPELDAREFSLSATRKAYRGRKKLPIPMCSALIEEKYRKTQDLLKQLVNMFQEEFPTKVGQKGWLLTIRKDYEDPAGPSPYKLYWRKYHFKAFAKKIDSNSLAPTGKTKTKFEFGKKRYLKLPSSFWQQRIHFSPDTIARFEEYQAEVIRLNEMMTLLAQMHKSIRAMVQSLDRNSLFRPSPFTYDEKEKAHG